MLKLLSTTAFLLLAGACTRNPTPPAAQAPCIDETKIRKDAMCPMIYAPVCGCDGKTYSNDCVATHAGVTTYTQGACPGSTTN